MQVEKVRQAKSKCKLQNAKVKSDDGLWYFCILTFAFCILTSPDPMPRPFIRPHPLDPTSRPADNPAAPGRRRMSHRGRARSGHGRARRGGGLSAVDVNQDQYRRWIAAGAGVMVVLLIGAAVWWQWPRERGPMGEVGDSSRRCYERAAVAFTSGFRLKVYSI